MPSNVPPSDTPKSRNIKIHNEKAKLFEIQLGHVCNNRCIFCSSGLLTEKKQASFISIDSIKNAIFEARNCGAERIIFQGGEPSLHPRFFDALKYSVDCGFREIVLFTNGTKLADSAFIDRVRERLSTCQPEWRISIQGGTKESHNAVTGNSRSFDIIRAGLINLKSRKERITVNSCINEYSYRTLPELPLFLSSMSVEHLHVDIIRPHSTGGRKRDLMLSIMPKYSSVSPYIDSMIERVLKECGGMKISIGNLPFCILPEKAAFIYHGGQKTLTRASNERGLEEVKNKYEWHASLREYPPFCDSCLYKPRCSGIYSEYLDLYGTDEFSPLK